MRQGVLERVLEVGNRARLVEKLGRLQLLQPRVKLRFALVGDDPEHVQRDGRTDDGGRFQQPLVLIGQAVDARGENRLHGGRHPDPLDRLSHPVGAPLAGEASGLHQAPHAFFDEERIASGVRQQESFQDLERGVRPEQVVEELVGVLGG